MSHTTMIRFYETGEPEVMKYERVPMPEPGPGEIRLAVEAIGVGYGECLYRRGFYIQDTVLPSSLGNHAVGTVDAIGPEVSGVRVGERVSLIPSFQMNTHGVYGEHMIVPAFAIAPYFDTMSVEENASLWMQVTTAYGALVHYGQLSADDSVLLIPASGGVGMAALQTCKKAGATSIVTTRSRDKAAKLKAMGADHVILTSEENLVERVREMTDGQGVRLVFNAMTGAVINDVVAATRPGGTVFLYGGIGGEPSPLPYAPMIGHGISLQGYTLYELTYHPENLPAIRQYVSDGVAQGHYTATIDRVFAFDEMVQVHHYLEAGSRSGSVVVKI